MDRNSAIGYYSRSFYAKRCFQNTILQAPSNLQARMAELVDALGSGPSAGNGVEVRVLFRAPKTKKPLRRFFFVPRKAEPCGSAWGLERFAMQGEPGSRLRDRVRRTHERSEPLSNYKHNHQSAFQA